MFRWAQTCSPKRQRCVYSNISFFLNSSVRWSFRGKGCKVKAYLALQTWKCFNIKFGLLKSSYMWWYLPQTSTTSIQYSWTSWAETRFWLYMSQRKRQSDLWQLHELTRSRTSREYPTRHPHYLLKQFFASWPLYSLCSLLECKQLVTAEHGRQNSRRVLFLDILHDTAPRIMPHTFLCCFLLRSLKILYKYRYSSRWISVLQKILYSSFTIIPIR
jgi:hypothetical protein